MRSASCLFLAALCVSCGQSSSAATPAPSPEAVSLGLPTPESFAEEHGSFASYWHQGVAELSRYSLRQARYGETHEGEAVLVFVTEPFLPDAQVKDDDGNAPDAVAVLKLNAYRRFHTGITAILPHGGNAFLEKVPAAIVVGACTPSMPTCARRSTAALYGRMRTIGAPGANVVCGASGVRMTM